MSQNLHKDMILCGLYVHKLARCSPLGSNAHLVSNVKEWQQVLCFADVGNFAPLFLCWVNACWVVCTACKAASNMLMYSSCVSDPVDAMSFSLF